MTALTEVETKWIEKFGAVQQTAEQEGRRREQRQQALQKIYHDIEANRDVIRQGQTYQIELREDATFKAAVKSFFGRAEVLSSLDPDSDAMQEIDTWHDLPNAKGLPPEQVKKIIESFNLVLKMSHELENAKDDEGNLLFPPDDPDDPESGNSAIANELWQSLVREGVIPENAVPDKYSEVRLTFKAASAKYQERLTEYSKNLGDNAQLLEVLGKGKYFIDKGMAFAGGVGGLAGASPEDLQLIGTINVAMTSSITIAEEVVKREEVDNLLDAFGKILNDVVVGNVADKETARIVKLAYGSLSASGKFAFHAKKGEIESSVNSIGDFFASFLPLFDDGSSDKKYENIGSAIQKSCKGLGTVAAASKALKEGNRDEFFKKLTEAFKQISGEIAEQLRSKQLDDATPSGLTTAELEKLQQDNAKKVEQFRGDIEKLSGDGAALFNLLKRDRSVEEALEQARANEAAIKQLTTVDAREAFVGFLADNGAERALQLALLYADKAETLLTSDAREVLAEKMKREGVDDAFAKAKALDDKLKNFAEKLAEQEVAEDMENFENILAQGFSAARDDDESQIQFEQRQLANIEAMIAQMKKDQAVFELAKSIAKSGVSVVTKFVPGAKIASFALDLAANFVKAANHARQLLAWLENVADAKTAVTVQADAMLNRLGLEEKQNLEAQIQVLLDVSKIVGASIEVGGGVAAPAGTAVQAAAATAETAMEIISKIQTEAAMAQAWAVYNKALQVPQDRKLARKALRENPTLSKYAIAYGACVDTGHGGAIAKEAMRKCGLTEKVLSDPNTNVDKVVTYLETLYQEDPVLLKAIPVPADWHPGDPELTARSWGMFVVRAKSDASPKLAAAADVTGVNGAFAVFESARKSYVDYNGADDDKQPVVKTYETAIQGVEASLARFKPLGDDGKAHKPMLDYIDNLLALVKLERRELTKAEQERKLRIAQARQAASAN